MKYSLIIISEERYKLITFYCVTKPASTYFSYIEFVPYFTEDVLECCYISEVTVNIDIKKTV